MGHVGLLHILYLILPFKKIETILSSQAITQWATAGFGDGAGRGGAWLADRWSGAVLLRRTPRDRNVLCLHSPVQ